MIFPLTSEPDLIKKKKQLLEKYQFWLPYFPVENIYFLIDDKVTVVIFLISTEDITNDSLVFSNFLLEKTNIFHNDRLSDNNKNTVCKTLSCTLYMY